MPVHFYELLILSQKLNRNYMLKEEIIENEEAIARNWKNDHTHSHTHTWNAKNHFYTDRWSCSVLVDLIFKFTHDFRSIFPCDKFIFSLNLNQFHSASETTSNFFYTRKGRKGYQRENTQRVSERNYWIKVKNNFFCAPS